MPTDGHSKSQGWSLEAAAQVIANALWATLQKLFKKKAAFKKCAYSITSQHPNFIHKVMNIKVFFFTAGSWQ